MVNINGKREHATIERAKQVLVNLLHRGAAGADESTGDGAGILIQVPHEFLAAEADRLHMHLSGPGRYAVGMVFLPRDGDMQEIPGTEFSLQVDLVLLAIGFAHVVQPGLVTDLRLALTKRGNIHIDKRYMTSEEGVFAGGDAQMGAKLVVNAIDDGRMVAEGIEQWLEDGRFHR